MSLSLAADPIAPLPSARPQRFVIVDDHPIVREGLSAQLARSVPTSMVVYTGHSVRDAVRAALRLGCDCAIVDVNLGQGMSAVEIISSFSLHSLPIVVLDDQATAEACQAAFTAGARAYVGKHADPADIGTAIGAVLEGRTWMPRDLMTAPMGRVGGPELSAQERRALTLYASGLTQDMVARRMGIASSTVKHYLDKVREKCRVAGLPARTKLELHALARSQGLLP